MGFDVARMILHDNAAAMLAPLARISPREPAAA